MAKKKPKTKPSARPKAKTKPAPQSRREASKSAARKPAKRQSSRTPDAMKILRAIDALDAAHRLTRERGEQLLACADRLREVGESHRTATLITSLCGSGLLRDIASLAAAADGDWPESLKALKLFPAAMLAWLRGELTLEPELSIGEELETTVAKLERFDFANELATDSPIIRLRVLSPGWRRSGITVVKPTVEVIS